MQKKYRYAPTNQKTVSFSRKSRTSFCSSSLFFLTLRGMASLFSEFPMSYSSFSLLLFPFNFPAYICWNIINIPHSLPFHIFFAVSFRKILKFQHTRRENTTTRYGIQFWYYIVKQAKKIYLIVLCIIECKCIVSLIW